ncbi:pyridoxal phosphate-dependent transferase [Chytridium lagenaria]|nr:pyridoxal phosphate-dependent transferase [Chytridium lagenaria]
MTITQKPPPSVAIALFASPTLLQLFKNAVFYVVVIKALYRAYDLVALKGVEGAVKAVVAKSLQKLSTYARSFLPGANALNVASVQAKITGSALSDPLEKKYVTLPEKGLSDALVRMEHQRYLKFGKGGEEEWKSGKVSGCVYHGGDALNALITEAYGLWSISNVTLHPEVFPAIRRMEAEVISMCLRMYNGPETACGSMTSGGTESLLMAIKTYRDRAKHLKGVTEPEMIVPVTIHAAFDKGADYFGVKIVHIPVDAKKVKRAINRNTIMLAGSAPNFPHGIIDDIPALAALAQKHNIGMHVDACLGGFIVPFAGKAGYPLPHPVDFTVPYGFAPKGSSVIMYRDKELRNFQYFVTTEWPGGVYASPSIAGSRPGALIAGCWTAMVHMGESGYIETTRQILEATAKSPMVYGVGDLLSRKGWHLNMLQFPQAVHIACTLLTVPAAEQLVDDLREAVETLKRDPKAGNGDLAAIYGTVASIS